MIYDLRVRSREDWVNMDDLRNPLLPQRTYNLARLRIATLDIGTTGNRVWAVSQTCIPTRGLIEWVMHKSAFAIAPYTPSAAAHMYRTLRDCGPARVREP